MDFDNLAERLRTQDNACTADPVFCVQKRDMVWGIDPAYDHDGSVLIHDGEEMESGDLEAWGLTEDDCQRVYYVYRWETVTVHLTRDAAEEYRRENAHNLGRSRIFVESQYKAREWNAVVKMLNAATWFYAPSPEIILRHVSRGGLWMWRWPSGTLKLVHVDSNNHHDYLHWRPVDENALPVFYQDLIPVKTPC